MSLLPREITELRADELLVSETFWSIQGEASFAGWPCFFIRLTGCHLRCRWCDTEYSFFGGTRRSVAELVAEAEGHDLVEVTGGEPLLQRGVHELLAALADQGHTVLLETSGAVPIDRVDPRVRRIVDWKAPGSGETSRNHPSIVASLRAGDELKVVVADRADWDATLVWLRQARGTNPLVASEIPVHVAPVFGRLSNEELAAWILTDRAPVRLSLQLHKYIWPPDARGV